MTALYKKSVATATQRSPLLKGRRHSKPRNGDLEFSEELTMTALLYRGHSYEAGVSFCLHLSTDFPEGDGLGSEAG